MDAPAYGQPTEANTQQGSTPSVSVSQILHQLDSLYAILQRFYPEWCQENPFQKTVEGLSPAQLCELHVNWTQCVEYCQPQSHVAIPMGDPTEQRPHIDEMDYGFDINPEMQLSSGSFAGDGVDGGIDAIPLPGVHNGEQAETPRQPGAGYEFMNNGQDPPVPMPPPSTNMQVDAISDDNTISLPGWLSLVQPQPKDHVVTVRRECQVTLEINLRCLPDLHGHPVKIWKGLVIPSTAGVRTEDYGGEEDVLHLSLRVFGAVTGSKCNAVCTDCNKREGKKRGTPSLVDFQAASDVIKASKDGLARVKFKFSCYPKHQNPNESAYLLEVVISEQQPQGQAARLRRVLATFRLPWHFRVGKPPIGQAAFVPPAGGTVHPQTSDENLYEQQTVTGDTLTPRPNVEPVRRPPGNAQEPSVQPAPALSPSGGEAQVTPTSYSQISTPRLHPDPNLAARPSQKRRRDAADLDDGDAQTATGRRQVRPRLDPGYNAGVRSRTRNPRPNTPRAHLTAAPTQDETNPTLCGLGPSGGPFAISTAPATSSGTLSPSEPDSETTSDPSDNHTTGSQQRAGPDTRGRDTIPEPDGADITIHSINPDHGPVTGGIPVWLSVPNLPTEFHLFARFGPNVTSTVPINTQTLMCTLPSASSPGRVNVTLSRYRDPRQPQFGASVAEFVYKMGYDQLVEIILRMKQAGSNEYTPELQSVLKILDRPNNEQPPQGCSGGTTRNADVECSVIQALLSLHTQPNFQRIVSVSNEYSQTLAHLSVLYGFKSLLKHLIEWNVELGVTDNNGLTALHCAYLSGDRDSILLLRRGGAPTSIPDKLGRAPVDLWPGGPDSASEVEAGIAEDLKSGPPLAQNDVDEQVALGAQFDALEDASYGKNNPGDDGSSSDQDESSDAQDDDDHSPIGVDTSTPAPGPSTSRETAVERINQLLISRRSRKKLDPRIIPDTPHDSVVSNVAQKLRESEAEPAAIDYLCNGVFPSGTIYLEGLRDLMSAQEIAQFQAEEGAQKYRGLLTRELEVFSCRLCPEGNKLDFKDPEEALHHMTKSHFDMGYSCDCGCKQTYWRRSDLRKHTKATAITRTSP